MNRPDFPLVWDNTMRSTFAKCPRKCYWEFLEHWKPKGESVHLHAGAAWASALEATRRAFYEHGISPLLAIKLGLEHLAEVYGDFLPPERGSGSAKSLDRLIEAFAFYWRVYPLDKDPVQPYISPHTGKPMIEFSFVLPLDEENLRHPVTGEPILYSGRADMIATYAKAVSIYDDKTATSLGDSWAKQWQRRSQFTGYAWAANAYGIPVTQILVRGIALLKESIKNADAITVRTAHHLTEWHTQMCRDIKRAMKCWEEGYWDVNIDDACSGFGSCLFLHPCTSSNPQPWLEGEFVRKIWNPATREEILLEGNPNVGNLPYDD